MTVMYIDELKLVTGHRQRFASNCPTSSDNQTVFISFSNLPSYFFLNYTPAFRNQSQFNKVNKKSGEQSHKRTLLNK